MFMYIALGSMYYINLIYLNKSLISTALQCLTLTYIIR